MVAVTKFLSINCKKDSIHKIEKFVEDISKNVFINETYFGNLLTSISVLFQFLTKNGTCELLEFHYTTNYKNLKIEVKGSDKETMMKIVKKIDIENTDLNQEATDLFTIQQLTDEIKYSKKKNSLILIYDISAVHDQIYDRRKQLLKNYLKKVPNQEPAKNL